MPGATYTMVPSHTSGTVRFLEVQNASTAAGARIIQNRIGAGTTLPHQRFRITQAGVTGGGPYFRIRPTHVSGMCFDVEAASLFNNARVNQFPASRAIATSSSSSTRSSRGRPSTPSRPRHSGLRLGIAGASTGAGAPLQQFQDNGGANQRFLLTQVG